MLRDVARFALNQRCVSFRLQKRQHKKKNEHVSIKIENIKATSRGEKCCEITILSNVLSVLEIQQIVFPNLVKNHFKCI